MRLSLVALAFAAVVIVFSGAFFAATSDCLDGTKYFKCSTNPNNVGYRCGPNGLVRDLTCPCEAVPGFITQGTGDSATCVQAKCDDGTKTGECSQVQGANYKRVCVGGTTYTDNATQCGCPDSTKQDISPGGLACIYKPCSDGTKDSACSTKTPGKKCVQSSLVDKASDCPCKTGYTKQGEACVLLCSDQTVSGQCSSTKPKYCSDTGYLLDNAGKCGCPEGQVADGSGVRCVPAGIGGISGSDLLGGTAPASNASGTGTSAGLGGLQCCCLPTALIGLAGGFVFFRKKK